jgi:spore coat polysaccharide biosynthesis protein SpsF
MKILVVVQARTASSRLPNKVLMTILGKTVLEHQLERIVAAREPFELVVATTPSPADRAIFHACTRAGVECVAGHPTDLLDRHYRVARARRVDAVVKIPSDCPLIDPSALDRVIGHFRRNAADWDFVSNLHPATYPDGNDVEVMSVATLETAFREATRPFEREHTTPFIWERPERFRIDNVVCETGLDYSMTHRFTLDYPEDFAFVRTVFEHLWSPSRPVFSLASILSLLESNPPIGELNARYRGVNWYRHHLNELEHVSRSETRLLEEAR